MPALPRLLVATLAASALHGGAWLALGDPHDGGSGNTANTATPGEAHPPAAAMRVRAMHAPARPPDGPENLSEGAVPAPEGTPAHQAATAALPAPEAPEVPLWSLDPEANPQAPADAPADAPGEGPPQTYLGRDQLDAGPQPLAPVPIAFPPGVDPGSRHTGRVRLLIDEDGVVRALLWQDEVLPPPFQEAVRNAFMQARFQPGRLHGRAVRSRIDIEVSFDDRPSSEAAAADTPPPAEAPPGWRPPAPPAPRG